MNLLLKRFTVSTVLITIGFVGGGIFGFINGFNAFVLIDAAPQGAIAVAKLNALAANKTDRVKLIFEYDVDQSLAFHSMLSEAWWFPLYQSGFLFTYPDSEKYIRLVANYRKKHPSPSREDMFDKTPEGKEQYKSEYHELAIAHREHHRRINEMVRKYADKQPN
jgi:hypothetical protein